MIVTIFLCNGASAPFFYVIVSSWAVPRETLEIVMADLSQLGALMAIDRKRKFVRAIQGITELQRKSLLAELDAEQARMLAQQTLSFPDVLGAGGGEAPAPGVQPGASPEGRSKKG